MPRGRDGNGGDREGICAGPAALWGGIRGEGKRKGVQNKGERWGGGRARCPSASALLHYHSDEFNNGFSASPEIPPLRCGGFGLFLFASSFLSLLFFSAIDRMTLQFPYRTGGAAPGTDPDASRGAATEPPNCAAAHGTAMGNPSASVQILPREHCLQWDSRCRPCWRWKQQKSRSQKQRGRRCRGPCQAGCGGFAPRKAPAAVLRAGTGAQRCPQVSEAENEMFFPALGALIDREKGTRQDPPEPPWAFREGVPPTVGPEGTAGAPAARAITPAPTSQRGGWRR